LRDIAHECELLFAPRVGGGVAVFELFGDDLDASGLVGGGFWVEHVEAAEQFAVVWGALLWDADEHMEVVGHDGVSEYLDAAEVGDLPELFAKDFLCGVVEATLAVDGARHAVINGRRQVRCDFDARSSHGNRK